jgi:hypothetical protein
MSRSPRQAQRNLDLASRLARLVPTRQPAAVSSAYPLRPTLGLRVVNRARVDFKFPVERPLCVLGSDSYSKRWLMLNAEILVRSGALCYVIEAQTPAAVDAVRKLAPKVPGSCYSAAIPMTIFSHYTKHKAPLRRLWYQQGNRG